MAYDAQGNYVKSANELVAYMESSGRAFTDPVFVNTNSIFDMNPIIPASGAAGKSTNVLSNISTNVASLFGGNSQVTTILIMGLGIAIVAKIFKRR